MLLKIGSKGSDVETLQEKLGIPPDGIFGPNTEEKVKEWQTNNGLLSDGIVGDKTWAKLLEGDIFENITLSDDKFKLEKLKGVIPDSVIAQIPDTAKKFNITNVLRLSHFLSQCGHESGGFTIVHENLNYSSEGLKRVFGGYFPGDLANQYEHHPEKIGSRVYGSRMGNGPESTGEGYKYRGAGFIQTTGKSNYKAFSDFIGEDCVSNPNLIATKYPLASAAFFFNKNGLWSICDRGSDEETVKAVTKRVNGGYNGYSDRLQRFNKIYNLLK